jgi:hypothetical protein
MPPEEGDPAEKWELSPHPSLILGGAEADENAAFHHLRAGTTLPDGRIVLLQPSEITLFSPDGRFLKRLGGEGEGPGEFRNAVGIGLMPTSGLLRVLDSGNGRITELSPEEGAVSTEPMPHWWTFMFAHLVGQPDGSFVGAIRKGMLSLAGQDRRSAEVGPRTDSVLVLRISGSMVDTLSVQETGILVTARAGNMTLTLYPPFGRRLLTAAGPGIFAQGYSDEGKFRVFDLESREVGVARVRVQRRLITDEERAAAEEQFLVRYGRNPLSGQPLQGQLDDILKDAPRPDTLPLVDEAFFDTEGNLWLRQFDPLPRSEVVWEIHSERGDFLARALMPSDLQVFEIGPAHVLALRRDSLDVETVVRFALTRGRR